MAKTRHMQQRMSQRSIRQSLIDTTHQFGITSARGDVNKVVLNKKGIDKAMDALNTLKKELSDARKKGGVVIVESPDGTEITTYAADSYRRKH